MSALPDLSGKNCLITGANTGIGKATALELARAGAHITLACRSLARTQSAIDEIKRDTGNHEVHFLPLDLGDLDSVRQCARSVLDDDRPLHLLINNAGLAGHRGMTKSGFEITFGVNHLGHFLLTDLLLDRIKASAPARIVIVSSKAHYKATTIDFDTLQQTTKTLTGLPEYQVSKLANVLHAVELARRLEGTGVTTYSLHPGVVASDVWRKVPWPFRALMKRSMITNEEGALTTLHCAASPQAGSETGLYYDLARKKTPNPVSQDPALAKALWDKSVEWTS